MGQNGMGQLVNDGQRNLQSDDEQEEQAPVETKPGYFSSQRRLVDMNNHNGGAFGGHDDFGLDAYESQQVNEQPFNTAQMRQLLSQEKMAPELLPYQHQLVESICAQINLQDREIAART